MSQGHGEGPRVLRHPLASRLFHWGHIFGFLPAALTGCILWLKPGSEDFVNLAMRIHIAGAAVFTIAAMLYTVFCPDRVVGFIRRIFSFNNWDVDWLLAGGGYPQKILLGKKIFLPPMGKMNSGQKLLGICLLSGGIILIVTGWILYAFIPVLPKAFIYWADRLHLIIGILLGLSLLIHIFLGIYNRSEFKAMFGDGTQTLEEAKDHYPLWVANELEPLKKPESERRAAMR